MPLDLQRLRDGDPAEWERAWDKLQLWSVAKGSVERIVGGTFPQYVEDVAADALSELMHRAIHRCHGTGMIVPMLRTIGKNRAKDRLRRFWERFAVPQTDDLLEPADETQAAIRQRMEYLSDRLHLDGDLAAILDALVDNAELNLLEQAVLREHIVDGLTQQEFADRYGIPLGTIGRLKKNALTKVRRFLEIHMKVMQLR